MRRSAIIDIPESISGALSVSIGCTAPITKKAKCQKGRLEMKRFFITIAFTAFIAGVISYFPALLYCTLLEIDTNNALFYSLVISLSMLVFLPIPLFIRSRRERKVRAEFASQLGEKSYIWKVGILTKNTPVNAYFGFNDRMMNILAKFKERNYTISITKDSLIEIDFSHEPEIIIRTRKGKEYHLIAPQISQIQNALEKTGWNTVGLNED